MKRTHIKGFYDYEITDEGNIFRSHRLAKSDEMEWRPVKATPDKRGYLRISLYHHGICYKYYVHRLVAEHFVPNPAELSEVVYRDGDRTNNSATNLKWVEGWRDRKVYNKV